MLQYWPQMLMILIFGAHIGLSAANHGKPRDGNYNISHAFVRVVILIAILYFGGFF